MLNEAIKAKQDYLATQLNYAKGWVAITSPLRDALENTILAEYPEVWPELLQVAQIAPCPGSFKFADPQRFGQDKLQDKQKKNMSGKTIPRKEPLPSSSSNSNAPLPMAAPSSSSSSGSSSSSYSGGSSGSSSYSGGSSSSSSYSSRDYGKRGDRDRDWDNRSSERQSRKPATKRSYTPAQQAPNKRAFIPTCPAGLSCAVRGRCGFHHSNTELMAFLPPLPVDMPPLDQPVPEAVAAEAAARAAAVASAARIVKAGGEVAKTHSDVATALAQHEEAEEHPTYSPLTSSNSDEDEGDYGKTYAGDETDWQQGR